MWQWPGPILNISWDILSQDLVKYLSRDIDSWNHRIIYNLDRCHGGHNFEMPVDFGGETIILNAIVSF